MSGAVVSFSRNACQVIHQYRTHVKQNTFDDAPFGTLLYKLESLKQKHAAEKRDLELKQQEEMHRLMLGRSLDFRKKLRLEYPRSPPVASGATRDDDGLA